MHVAPSVLLVLPAATTPRGSYALFHGSDLMAALTSLLRTVVSLKVAQCQDSALQAFLDAEHSNMAQLAEQLGTLMTVNDEMVRPVIQEDKTQPGFPN